MSLGQMASVLGPRHDEAQGLLPRVAYTKGGPTLNIDPLPSAHRNGLIAVFIMAILSFIATLVLISFITYRLVFWRSNYRRYIGYNQYVILIYNLVLADLQQSLAFLICLKWIVSNKIEASSAACFLQGFWLQIGDPSSGLFVLAIAIHTFFLVTMGRKISHRIFVISVVSTWVFVAILVVIPIGLYGKSVFIPSGAWVRPLSLILIVSATNPAGSAGSTRNTSLFVCGRTIFGFSWQSSEPSACTLSCGSNCVVGSNSLRFLDTARRRA